ncbi:helix-turn-helix domain-containing protein [Klebsiella aerogenes]|uniref:helix-turn-helix domain-containing protein n=1 Tax=Klebsiella aerogenes TaxID=548 RepID=UPI0006961B39|nr:helix-turn-helix domain-containing protein [Klebsiella aerogenes]
MLSINEIQKKHEAKVEGNEAGQAFIKVHAYFDDIETVYSAAVPQGLKLNMTHIILYSTFLSYQVNGKTCHEGQEKLAKRCKVSDRTVRRHMEQLIELGLVEYETRKTSYGTYQYKALPITDAHLNPPETMKEVQEVKEPDLPVAEVKQKAPEATVTPTADETKAPEQKPVETHTQAPVASMDDFEDDTEDDDQNDDVMLPASEPKQIKPKRNYTSRLVHYVSKIDDRKLQETDDEWYERITKEDGFQHDPDFYAELMATHGAAIAFAYIAF